MPLENGDDFSGELNSLAVRSLDLEPDIMVRPVCGYNVVVWVL